jgi:DNA-binding IclR family transcriptional regulator
MRHLRGEVVEPDAAIATAPPGAGACRASPQADGVARAYNIAAVDRALDLLEALARIGPASLAALSQEAGCTRTAGFRLLRTMQARGFAIQDHARGLWRLGARWSMLSRAAAGQGALAATAQPFLASLAEAVNENTYFITRAGLEGEVIALHRADPNLRVYVELGKPFALHAGPGRLLLAYAPESVLTQVLARKLARFTPTTRIEPAWIMADLQRLRARHWISTADEMFAGGVSIAATVCDASGDVVGALVIAAPALRMRPPRPRSLLPILEETAAAMSEALGAPSRNAVAGAEPMRALGGARPLAGRALSAGAPAQLALSRDA